MRNESRYEFCNTEFISRRRTSLFGHIARLDAAVPAHQALCLQMNISTRWNPGTSWKRLPGRPRKTWTSQISDDTGMSSRAYWDASIRRGHERGTLRSLKTTRWWWWWWWSVTDSVCYTGVTGTCDVELLVTTSDQVVSVSVKSCRRRRSSSSSSSRQVMLFYSSSAGCRQVVVVRCRHAAVAHLRHLTALGVLAGVTLRTGSVRTIEMSGVGCGNGGMNGWGEDAGGGVLVVVVWCGVERELGAAGGRSQVKQASRWRHVGMPRQRHGRTMTSLTGHLTIASLNSFFLHRYRTIHLHTQIQSTVIATTRYNKVTVPVRYNVVYILGGPTKVKPTYIFVCKIWIKFWMDR